VAHSNNSGRSCSGGAAVALAQLTDTQTASGTLTASSTSADLYICEPGGVAGPACGPDDSAADETVFETLENIRPGQVVQWDIRLQNAGAQDLLLTGVALNIAEVADPGSDCPDTALQAGRLIIVSSGSSSAARPTAGVYVLGKGGDDLNDNIPFASFGTSSILPLVPAFSRESSTFSTVHIKIAAGDFEDLRLRLELVAFVVSEFFPAPTPASTANCDGNEWNVSWQFTAS